MNHSDTELLDVNDKDKGQNALAKEVMDLQAITCSYYREDATDDGPLDFTSSAGVGKNKIFRQDDGGAFMAVPIWIGHVCRASRGPDLEDQTADGPRQRRNAGEICS